jgi:F-type H+-transporting ATPase subunit alpha
MSAEAGGGSLTALPIIETQAGDISDYIPTNVISITDGQIFLESDLFYKGIRPAVSVGKSVSRVGGAAQTKAVKQVAGTLKLSLAQYRDLEAFAAFASDLDPASKAQLARGERLVELLKQSQYTPYEVADQVISVYAATNGYVDAYPVADVRRYEKEMLTFIKQKFPKVIETISSEKKVSDEIKKQLEDALKEFKAIFEPTKK